LLPLLNKETPPSREEFAYEKIKEAILFGDLRPNQKISLTSLAESLGISIIPVKIAIQKLISEGLINQNAHHSPIVADFSHKEANEILLIRYHLEELALKKSIPFIDRDGLDGLRLHLVRLSEAVKKSDHRAYGKINRQFHMAIYQYCGSPILCNMIEDLWDKSELNRSRSVFTLYPELTAHSFEDHCLLLRFIEEKNIDEAMRIHKQHRDFSYNRLKETFNIPAEQ